MYGQCFEYISMKAKRICNKKIYISFTNLNVTCFLALV